MPPLDQTTMLSWAQQVLGYLSLPLAIVIGAWVGSVVFTWIKRMLGGQ